MEQLRYKLASFRLNWRTAHHRMMARFLRKRGWVVFWLTEEARTCKDGQCWLELYNRTTH